VDDVTGQELLLPWVVEKEMDTDSPAPSCWKSAVSQGVQQQEPFLPCMMDLAKVYGGYKQAEV
jgi:hypothetical protein